MSGVNFGGIVELEVAVDLVGGDVVQALAVPADRFEQLIGADHVRLDERPRRVQRVVVVGLGREVHDGVTSEPRRRRSAARRRCRPATSDTRSRPSTFAAVARVRQQVVDDDLPVGPLAVDVAHEVRADEAGAAGDQQPHARDPRGQVWRQAVAPIRQDRHRGRARIAARCRPAAEPGAETQRVLQVRTSTVVACVARRISVANSNHEHSPAAAT